jgi:hypothetical protein
MKTFIFAILLVIIFSFGNIERALAQPGSESRVIVQGNPPLTESMAAKTIILLEWALDIKFSDDQKKMIIQEVINNWKTNKREEMRVTVEIAETVDNLRKASPEDRNKVKATLQAEILKNLRNDEDDKINQMVLEVYDAARKSSTEDSLTADNSNRNSNGYNSLVGKWDSFGNYTSYEFFPDGSYIYHARVKMTNLTCPTTLITRITGKYSVQGTTLTLNPASGTNEFNYSCPTRTEKKIVDNLEKTTLTLRFDRDENREKFCFAREGTEACYYKI